MEPTPKGWEPTLWREPTQKTPESHGVVPLKGLTLIFSKLRKSWDTVVASKNPKANTQPPFGCIFQNPEG